jgi:hypothetical protein
LRGRSDGDPPRLKKRREYSEENLKKYEDIKVQEHKGFIHPKSPVISPIGR